MCDRSRKRRPLDVSKKVFKNLTNPQSIVVVGASSDFGKPGGRVLKNIKDYGFKGDLLAVNPKARPILGLPTYKSILDLPAAPSLAIIAIPAPFVAAAMEELGKIGIDTVIVLSAGFSEKDENGKREEEKVLSIANKSGMTLIGPNCVGILTPAYAGKFAGIVPPLKQGSVDFISCSGATVDQVMEQASVRGLSFCNIITTGNSAQMGVEDVLALFDENFGPESSRVLLLYMESIKKPLKLLQHARNLTRKGCILVGIKSGVTQAGERAAASHTGAMATNDSAVDALFEKGGIIRLQSKVELIDVACVLLATHGPTQGRRACIITDAGGPGVMLSDELNRQGFEVPPLKEKTQKKMLEILPPMSPVGNPIDCLPTRNGVQVRAILQVLEREEKDNIDIVIIITSNSMLIDNWDTYEAILEGMETSSIPIIPVLSPASTCVDLIDRFRQRGGVYFHDEVPIAKALGKIERRPSMSDPVTVTEQWHRERIARSLNAQKGALPHDAVSDILASAGFKLPPQAQANDKMSLQEACDEIGYPLALKVLGPLHKTEAGGVKLGITTLEEAHRAFEEIMEIEGASGVLVQRMVEGHEVIMGATREQGFGHLMMFGMGGIYAEIFSDVQFALAPLGSEECTGMIKGIKGLRILQGHRGQKGISLELAKEYLIRLSLLVSDFPQIKEVDLNPVKGVDASLYVVDASIIVG